MNNEYFTQNLETIKKQAELDAIELKEKTIYDAKIIATGINKNKQNVDQVYFMVELQGEGVQGKTITRSYVIGENKNALQSKIGFTDLVLLMNSLHLPFENEKELINKLYDAKEMLVTVTNKLVVDKENVKIIYNNYTLKGYDN